jgi:hypothetical protein
MIAKYERLIMSLILIGFVVLALGFSLGPVFEGPDEIEHYRFIRTIQRTGGLPNPAGQPNGEYHQAPLYYLLTAPIAALFPDDEDFTQIESRRNPYYGFRVSIPGNDNKNIYVHTRTEAFPYGESATARAVHVLRLFSVVIGVGTIFTSYAVFRTLWPDFPERRLHALAIVAFWPQVAYISGVISNDSLAILLATISLWLMLRMQRFGPSWQGAILLGLALGAALLTKASLLVLALPMGIWVVTDRRIWQSVIVILLLVIIVGGWWYLRKAVLYDDPTGIQSMLKAWPWLARQPGENGLIEAVYAYFTVWARFGYGAVTVDAILYRIFDVLVSLTVTGLLLRGNRLRWQGTAEPLAVIHTITIVAFVLAWVMVVIYGSAIARASNHGRFVLPGIVPWVALQTLGLEMWMHPRWRRVLSVAGVAVYAGLAVICLFGYFYPAYRTAAASGIPVQTLRLRYGDVAELIGLSPLSLDVQPGEVVALELYWRALQPAPPWLEVHLSTEPEVENILRRSLPGNGHRPADDWLPGEEWMERYEIVIPPDLPDGAALVVSLFEPGSQTELAVVDMTNNTALGTEPMLGTFNITPADSKQ